MGRGKDRGKGRGRGRGSARLPVPFGFVLDKHAKLLQIHEAQHVLVAVDLQNLPPEELKLLLWDAVVAEAFEA